MKCEICGKDVDNLVRFQGKDMCGVCQRTILEARKPDNPKKGDKREYIEK